MEKKAFHLHDFTLDDLSATSTADVSVTEDERNKEIAVIGLAVRLPLADDVETFWQHLVGGVDCIRPLPRARRTDIDHYLQVVKGQREEAKYLEGGFLEQIDGFDYKLFRVSPREASLMNPSQRLFLETVYEAVEDAGYGGNKLSGSKTGVYVGYMADTEGDAYKRMIRDTEGVMEPLVVSANLASLIPTRISYLLDLKGPSMLVDTACSSSLVAIHMASQALRSGECDMALAGGVKLNVLPLDTGERSGIESSDGRTRTFDESSDGTGFGEGVGCVVLKPLAQAVKDGDHIYAVLKGSAINQDGSSLGITAPNADAQTDVMMKAWQDADVDPETIRYIEAFGTGTRLGDPIEIEGMQQAFRRYTDQRQFCAVGTVKTNIGHLYDAAGVVSFIKAVLSLTNKQLPPILHFTKPNARIDFAQSPFYVNDRLQTWETDGTPRRCGVNAYGFSGTNCHVVLEEAPARPAADREEANGPQVFTLSAKSERALSAWVKRYQHFLDEHPDISLRDLCYTQNTGRAVHRYRLAMVVESTEQLTQKLTQWLEQGWVEEYADGATELTQRCRLYIEGADVDWSLLYEKGKDRLIHLPAYPFERERCWIGGGADANSHLLLTGKSDSSAYTVWERQIAEIWSEVLGFHELDVQAGIFALGVDSLSLMKLVHLLQERLGVIVSMEDVIREQTIQQLAAWMQQHGNLAKSQGGLYPLIQPDPSVLYEPFAVTEIQAAYLVGRDEQFELGGVSTHFYLEVQTQLDLPRLEASLNQTIERHPMLRAVFLPSGEQQILADVPPYRIEVEDLRGLSAEEQQASIESERAKRSHMVFDPEVWPLFAWKALRLSDETHDLFIGFDMLIADASSLKLIAQEVMDGYEQPEQERPPLALTFRDYMQAYHGLKDTSLYARDREYWLHRLADFPAAPRLPLRIEPTLVKKPSYSRLTKTFGQTEWKHLKARAKQEQVTLSALLYTAYATVLAYWSNQPHIAINVTVFNRYPFHAEVEQLVGDFTSVLLLDMQVKPAEDFFVRARRVQSTMLEGLAHRHYDGVELIREYGRLHQLGKRAAMPVVFTSLLFGEGWDAWARLGTCTYSVSQTPQVYLDHQVAETNGELVLNWDYVEALFEPEMIERMFAQYVAFISQLIENKASEQEPSEADRQLLACYNDTAEAYVPTSLHRLFVEQVAKTPDKVAIRSGEQSITYEELNRRSNQLACYLQAERVGRNQLIGVLAERKIETVINILGILKVGAAYVPIDPDYPKERQAYMLEHSGCTLLLSSDFMQEKQIDHGFDEACKVAPIDEIHHPTDVAYVIYTSGSTGKPKGVVTTHQAAANTILAVNRKWQVNQTDVILGISSLCFDLSVYDLFGALSTGATLVQMADQRDMHDLRAKLVTEKITLWNSVPAVMDLLIEHLAGLGEGQATPLRLIFLSGDKIPLPLPVKIAAIFPQAEVVSLGGATEASIWSIYYPISGAEAEWKTIPYGMPLANQRFYVLNHAGILCPSGVEGELYIGGKGLALGYLRDVEKTEQAFIWNPEYGRLYRTGDYGILHPQGYIEFRGRKDAQVKIRGYRVECGEIENVLLSHPLVKQAVVIDRVVDGSTCLVAYLVGEQPLVVAELRECLSEQLPPYMIPAYFIQIESLPLTPNGKVDRRALPAPTPNAKGVVKQTPSGARNPTEAKLVAICADILGVERVGVSVTDSFFQLGMNSLQMMQMITQISKEWQQTIHFRDFINQNNIAELSLVLGVQADESGSIKTAPATEPLLVVYPTEQADSEQMHQPFPLTDVQMAYFLGRDQAIELGGVATHFYAEFKTQLEMKRLEQAFQRVIARHPMLRAIVLASGQQQILSDVPPYAITVTDGSGWNPEAQAVHIAKERERMSHQVFPTHQWPLFELQALRLDDETHYLFFGFDLLIADAASMLKVGRDLMQLYHQPEWELPPLAFSFRDYVRSLHEFTHSPVYERDRTYWLQQLPDFPSAPSLPLLKDPAEVKEPRFARVEKHFAQADWEQLKQKAQAHRVTPSALLCTAYAEALAYWSNQSRLAINLTVFNRLPFHAEVESIVGDFTSVVLIDVELTPNRTFWERAQAVQAKMMEALEHRHYDGVSFIREYAKYHNLGPKAVMPIVFTSLLFQDRLDGQAGWFELGELQLALSQTSQVYLDHQVMEQSGHLSITWDYVAELFAPDVIKGLFALYTGLLTHLIESDQEYERRPSETDLVLIEAYNQTDEPIEPRTLHGLFIEQAERLPEKIAVVCEEETITYRELARRSTQVAQQLREQGISRHQFVAVWAERNIETIINILGILRAGAAYVPIEPDYPTERQQYMIEDSGCCLILTPAFADPKPLYPIEPMTDEDHPTDTAYMIYTSGSTGKPKGVVITHQAVTNTIQDINQEFAVSEQDKILGVSSLCFDLSVYDLFGALSTGATLVIVPELRDVEHVYEVMSREQVTIWNSAPAVMDMLLEQRGGWQVVAETAKQESAATTQHVTKKPEVLADTLRTLGQMFTPESELFTNCYQEELLYSAEAYQAFKKAQLSRQVLPSSTVISLPITTHYPATITERRSYRTFDEVTLIPFADFAAVLAVCRQNREDDDLRYYYASAGGLYPIDVYVYVKANRIEQVPGGLYVYSARDNELRLISETQAITPDGQYFVNKAMAQSSAFTIYLVYNAEVTMPRYGTRGYYYALLDAGIMVSTLTHAAELVDICVCSVGEIMFERIAEHFQLSDTQVLLHSIECGRKPPSDPRGRDVAHKSKETTPMQSIPSPPLQANTSLRLVMLSGDSIPLTLPEKIKQTFPAARVLSLGGATEASIWSIYHPIEKVKPEWGSIPYGRPLANQRFYVLNDRRELCPLGVQGELYIGGTGLAQGYRNDAEKTDAAFILHPQLGRLYKTGDYGILHRDGVIQFLGRQDDQVKIRGYRIELSEITACLFRHPLITNAIVIHTPDHHGKKQLVAYYVTAHSTDLRSSELRDHLQQTLPDYMMPSTFVRLEQVPLTPNGKINRGALPTPVRSERACILPRNKVEEQLHTIWTEVLGVEQISVDASFFESGGDSLLLVRIHSLIEQQYPGTLKITDLFIYPTITKLAAHLANVAPQVASLPTADVEHGAKETEEADTHDIAVIGMSLNLPTATSPEAFWHILQSGVDLTRPFPERRRRDIDQYARQSLQMQGAIDYVEAAYLDQIDLFDYEAFGLTHERACYMSPTQRLFLEVAHQALTDAGYAREALSGKKVGVYLGASDFLHGNYLQIIGQRIHQNTMMATVGNMPAMLPTRLAHLLDLHGPSMVIDTACSSSLTAVHVASQALRNNECEMALVAGVRVHLFPFSSTPMLGFESSDGRTRSFDNSASGAGIGEGAIALLLKPLYKAQQDGDPIHAIIKGSAINQDGNSIGITAPNAAAQADVIEQAWQDAKIDPTTISYIEAHGSATKLGDPVEVAGITRAFATYTADKQFCAIGSVKSNIGHLYDVSGLAGMVKAILSLQQKQLPPTVHFEQPNQNINFAASPVYVNDRLREWESKAGPRRCGVSSFGISGTNAHVILQEAPTCSANARPNLYHFSRKRCWIVPI